VNGQQKHEILEVKLNQKLHII